MALGESAAHSLGGSAPSSPNTTRSARAFAPSSLRPLSHCQLENAQPLPPKASGEWPRPVATAPPAPAPASPASLPPGSGSTSLLAVSPGAPPAMRRATWCLQDYDIQKRIYRGATSSVYKAACKLSGLPVALKVYFLSRVPSNTVHMVIREVKLHTELVHAHIVTLYGTFMDERLLVLVQEWAGRGDLYGVRRALPRRMGEGQLRELVLAPFLEGLAHLHAKGICHRDIKPENILFSSDWRLMIADFGVSINLHQERAVTRAGTLEYMAPEVERCPLKALPEDNKGDASLAYTTAADVWGVGVLAYELLVGFPPFVQPASPPAATGPPPRGGSAFPAAHGGSKALRFPASTSPAARDFITAALAEAPAERPTVQQLLRHPWLAGQAAGQGRRGSAEHASQGRW